MMSTTTRQNKVIVIEPTIKFGSKEAATVKRKLNVAAYARVSTEQDAQQQSYAAQVDYYTTFIKNNEDWEFAGVYADEGITGTNTKNREGFKKMVKDAKDGKIDIILTKSISRFARNTVDALTTIRELKALGIEVRFEKENIRTLDPQCEVMLTILSSLAQEESRNISSNVQWAKRKNMMDGRIEIPYSSFLGYRKGKDGRPEIVPEEAEIVKRIFRRYVEGARFKAIAKELTQDRVPSPGGKENWAPSTIRSILRNEKYKGDALLQKTITVDYLSKKRKKNEGERAQYYVKNSHPAIIPPDIFDYVQYELKRRDQEKNRAYDKSALTGRIICGECGGYYGHKTCHYGKKIYEFWGCNLRHKSRAKCKGPNVRVRDIYSAFGEALMEAKRNNKEKPLSKKAAQETRRKLEEELQKAELALEKAKEKQNLSEREKYKDDRFYLQKEEIAKQLELKQEAYNTAKDKVMQFIAKQIKLKIFLEAIQDINDTPEFEDSLFIKTVERVVVNDINGQDYELKFLFANGQEVAVKRSTALCR